MRRPALYSRSRLPVPPAGETAADAAAPAAATTAAQSGRIKALATDPRILWMAIGLMFAAHLAQVLGRIPVERVDEHFAVVGEAYALGVDLPVGLHPDVLLDLMRHDKKELDGLTFVLDGPNGVEVVVGVDDESVLAALSRMAA